VLGFRKIVEKEVFNLSLLAIETFWYMNLLQQNGHHINKDLYIWKVFESIYGRKKKWMKKSVLFWLSEAESPAYKHPWIWQTLVLRSTFWMNQQA
jgi:hypothetical protein